MKIEIEPYVCIQDDGKLILLNGAFTPEELRNILDEAAQRPQCLACGGGTTWHGPPLQNLPREPDRCTGVEIDTDELLL
jgi:hypothetical protein